MIADRLTPAQIAERLRSAVIIQARSQPTAPDRAPLAFVLCVAYAFPGEIIPILPLTPEPASR